MRPSAPWALSSIIACDPGDDAATRFLKALPFEDWPAKLKELLPNASFDLVNNGTSGIGAIIVLHARRRLPVAERDAQKLKADM